MWARGMGRGFPGIDIASREAGMHRPKGLCVEEVDLNGPFPFRDGEFSCATCIEVVEHLVLAEKAFSEISRVLSRGGGLLFTTPNNASYCRKIKVLKGQAPDDEDHLRFWVRELLQEKLESADIGVERRNSYGYLPFVDTLEIYKAKTRKRRNIRIGGDFESIFADQFIWFLRKS